MTEFTQDAAHPASWVTVAETGQRFLVHPGERLLGAARRAGVWLPFECGWGSCGTCKVTMVEGEAEALFAAPCVNDRDARRGRVAACQTTVRSDAVIKPLRVDAGPDPVRPVRDYAAELVMHEELGPDLARFGFALDAPAFFRPGQHAILGLGDGLRRCYSMACQPGTPRVDFIAKRYAGRPGSERLFDLAVGSRISIELPYGDSYLRDSDRDVVLVAGGTGISAILALAGQLASEGPRWRADGTSRSVHVFYGAGRLADLICHDELDTFTSRAGGVLTPVLLDPPPGWAGASGVVTDALVAALPALTEAEFYVTGPPVMANAALAVLRDAGVGLDRVHFDSFG